MKDRDLDTKQWDDLGLLFIMNIRLGEGVDVLLLLGRSNARVIARSVWCQLPCQLLPSRPVSSCLGEALPSLVLRC